MRTALKCLLVIALVLSGLHLGEPAHAGEDPLDHQLAHASHMPDIGDEDSESAPHMAHAGHHHCPLAPDGESTPVVQPGASAAAIHSSRPVTELHSLKRAPPLEPPSA